MEVSPNSPIVILMLTVAGILIGWSLYRAWHRMHYFSIRFRNPNWKKRFSGDEYSASYTSRNMLLVTHRLDEAIEAMQYLFSEGFAVRMFRNDVKNDVPFNRYQYWFIMNLIRDYRFDEQSIRRYEDAVRNNDRTFLRMQVGYLMGLTQAKVGITDDDWRLFGASREIAVGYFLIVTRIVVQRWKSRFNRFEEQVFATAN